MKTNHSKVLEIIQKRCEKNSNVVGLVVFGSFATNQHTNNSDLDIILSFKQLPQPIQERNKIVDEILQNVEEEYGVEINPILAHDSSIVISPLLIEIATYGKIILDKHSTFTTIFSTIQKQYSQNQFQKIQKEGYRIIQMK